MSKIKADRRWLMPIHLAIFAALIGFAAAGNASAQWATNGNNINNTNSGNVGVGTSSPSAKLHVVGDNGPNNNTIAPAPDALQVSGGTGGNGNWGGSPGGIGGAINFTGGTGGPAASGSQAAIGGKGGSINLTGGTGGPNIFSVGGGAGGDIVLNGGAGVANSNGNIILGNLRGNVGIGTTNPAVRLDLLGNNVPYGGQLRLAASDYAQITFFNSNNLALNDSGRKASIYYDVGASQFVIMNSNGGGYDGPLLLNPNGGNIGIGTFSPVYRLDVQSPSSIIARFVSTAAAHNQVLIDAPNGFNSNLTLQHAGVPKWYLGNRAANHRFSFIESTGSVEVFSILQNGNVGVGTTTPSTKLHVVGDVTVTGNISAKYQDVAEWVPTSQKLAPGTVVVLDAERGSDVVASHQPYDTKVAGVISAKPGLALGESGDDKVLVATTGRLRVKVDATRGPIRVGDLLVTSDTRGYAMKSEPIVVNGRSIHSPGTLIGKALEPLEKGAGEIMVLLSLQ